MEGRQLKKKIYGKSCTLLSSKTSQGGRRQARGEGPDGRGVSAQPWAAVGCKFLAGWGLRAPGLSDQHQRALVQPSPALLCPDSGHPTQQAYAITFRFHFSENCFCQRLWSWGSKQLPRIFATLWEQPFLSHKFWVKILHSAIHQLYNLSGCISARDSHNYSMIPLQD